MKLLCPNCEKEQEVTEVKQETIIKVRGEDIKVIVSGYICNECGEFIAKPGTDELEEAYRIYESKYGINPRYQGKKNREFIDEISNELMRISFSLSTIQTDLKNTLDKIRNLGDEGRFIIWQSQEWLQCLQRITDSGYSISEALEDLCKLNLKKDQNK
jgi:YgiT-type zinc finger domain-containing protein